MHRWNTEIHVYTGGAALVRQYTEHHFYDLVLLDMRMDGMSGCETADKIRRIDDRTVIVIVAGSMDFAREGFKFSAFRYVLKSRLDSELEEALSHAVEKVRLGREQLFIIRSRDEITRLYLRNIVYFEYADRTVTVHTIMGNYSFGSKISDIEQSLSGKGFVRCYKSLIVNAEYIWKVRDYEIYLTTGHKLPVSRKYLRQTMDAVAVSMED